MATAPRKRKPPGPPGRAFGRSLSDFGKLSEAEQKLLVACREGEPCILGNTLPKRATRANTIRAGLIRFLALGGDDKNPVHERGVELAGAWIAGQLDLSACHVQKRLALVNSVFDEPIVAHGARVSGLYLQSSSIKGLGADRLTCDGAIQLSGLTATGEVRLLGATIGGNLSCRGARFDNAEGTALACDGMTVKSSVFLDCDDKKPFTAMGEVRLAGATIGGNLECRGARFDDAKGTALNCDRMTVKCDVFLDGDREKSFTATGAVRLLGATIGGNLDCSGARFENAKGIALHCDGMTVKGAVFLVGGMTAKGGISLAAASLGDLIDDCRAMPAPLALDGLTYQRIAGDASTRAEDRIAWLQRQPAEHLADDFRPQPWEQVIKVLRDMGHPDEARKVAMAKQDALRMAGKVGGTPQRQLHWLYGLLAGYGYRPLRTVAAMGLVWLLGSLAFAMAGDLGLMGPTSPIITANPAISAACGLGDGFRETLWIRCHALPQEYTTFFSPLYSLDHILPLVNLQQEADWAPIVMKDDGATNIWQGHVFRALMWFEILFGWAMSLLLAAVLGNLVKKD